MKNRIGFKHYDKLNVENNNVSETVNNNENRSMILSPAHADLLETIKNLSEIIVDKSFIDFAEEKRIAFVTQLINSVSLNAELTAKTAMLM